MISHEGTSVAIKYITTIQCYEWTPATSMTKCYGIRIYIDGYPGTAVLSAFYTKLEERDKQYNRWVAAVQQASKPHARPDTGPL